MKVTHLSVECFPVAKVGGLADVVGALPKYQRNIGIDASVVMPWYDRPFVKSHVLQAVYQGSFYQGYDVLSYTVWKEEESLGFPLFLIQIPGYLDRPEVYCYPDEAKQWIAFQHAFLDWCLFMDTLPDIIHCHDHHVGLVPFLLKYGNDYNKLRHIKTIFTVHNGQYQGWMNWSMSNLMPAYDSWKWGMLDWSGVINPMAAAIKCTDRYTTVSEGYLEELFVEANGLQDLFSHERNKAVGIVNGIDTEYWNPEIDGAIACNYSDENAITGKLENKKIFCEKVGLDKNVPLLSFIGRFAIEKGADLLSDILREIHSYYGNEIAIFILGSGDAFIQDELAKLALQQEGKLSVFFGYNENLAHEVYAASDLLLMPSRVEPCGLNQLYALKYGTIPIVRNIGGLKDTVKDIVESDGYGFVFEDININQIVEAIDRALQAAKDKEKWSTIVQRAMSLDYSWDKSAHKYKNLYNQLI